MSNEAKTHVIDGKTYVEVERKANVGEKVVFVKSNVYPVGFIGTVREIDTDFDDGSFSMHEDIDGENFVDNDEDVYSVLEPVDQAPASTDDIIANLVRRVASLESQLRDTQNNVERQGVEISAKERAIDELYGRMSHVEDAVESNEEDIRTLDERTQPKPSENKSVPTTNRPQVFDLAKIKSFKLSDLAGKTLRIHSATDIAEGISVTTTVAIDVNDGKMYVLESEVIR